MLNWSLVLPIFATAFPAPAIILPTVRSLAPIFIVPNPVAMLPAVSAPTPVMFV